MASLDDLVDTVGLKQSEEICEEDVGIVNELSATLDGAHLSSAGRRAPLFIDPPPGTFRVEGTPLGDDILDVDGDARRYGPAGIGIS